jgi:hypothetical protein
MKYYFMKITDHKNFNAFAYCKLINYVQHNLLLETSRQLVKKFPQFHGNQISFLMMTRNCYWCLSSDRRFQSTPSHCSLMFVPCIIRRSGNDQQHALICTTPLFYILSLTYFGSSLPSSGTNHDTPTHRPRNHTLYDIQPFDLYFR